MSELKVFDFPKNKILRSINLPILTNKNTHFLVLPNLVLLLHESEWITLDQETFNIVNNFKIRSFTPKAIDYDHNHGILGILKEEVLTSVSPSIYALKIAKLNQIDGSVDKFIEVTGFEQNDNVLDIAVESRYFYFLVDVFGKKKIKQYDVRTKQMLLLTDNLNNKVSFTKLKLNDDKLFLLDSIENSIYEINKFNGRSVAFKRQFPKPKIIDFSVKFNNLFVIQEGLDKLDQVSLSPEFSHISLQTNVYELATNGVNQSLIRGTIYNEAEEFQAFQPLKVRILKPIDLLQKYFNKEFTSLSTKKVRGLEYLPLLEKTEDCLFMDPYSTWEFVLGDIVEIEQIRLKFAQFRPGDIKVDILTSNGWQELRTTPLPLLFTREDIVFDNFFDSPTVDFLGIRIQNITDNTIAFQKLMVLQQDSLFGEKTATSYASDTAQTLFFVASPKTTINEVFNPRFLQGKIYWEFVGRSEILDETLITNDIGAFLHSIGDSKETYVKQNIVLNQPIPRIITASLFVKPDIVYINPDDTNCGLELTIKDLNNNVETYFQPFTIGNKGYERIFLSLVPPFPVYDIELKIKCQKDTKGSIEIDKIQLEQDKLHDYVDHIFPNIYIKTVYDY